MYRFVTTGSCQLCNMNYEFCIKEIRSCISNNLFSPLLEKHSAEPAENKCFTASVLNCRSVPPSLKPDLLIYSESYWQWHMNTVSAQMSQVNLTICWIVAIHTLKYNETLKLHSNTWWNLSVNSVNIFYMCFLKYFVTESTPWVRQTNWFKLLLFS